jgi:hypothetical protein
VVVRFVSLQVENKTQFRFTYAGRELDKEWRKHMNSIRNTYELSTEYEGYTKKPDIRLCGVPRIPRVLGAIDTFWGIKAKLANKGGKVVGNHQLKEGLWLDVSQQVHRLHSGRPGVLCTGALWYTFEFDCVLDGQDALALQGFPEFVASSDLFSSSEKRRLAGEAYHLGSFAAVAFAWYCNPWGQFWK